MTRPDAVGKAAKWMAVSGFVWTSLWILDVGSMLLTDVVWPGWIGQISTGRALLLHAVPWACWWLFTPVVFALAKRYRFADGQRVSSFVVHFGAGIATMFTTTAAMAAAQNAMQLGPRRFTFSIPDLTLYAAVAGTAVVLDLRRRERSLAGEVAAAKLQAVTGQLKPHFLYNALNGVAMLIRRDDRDAALSAVLGYAALLRATIHSDGADVPLAEELATIDRYLAIERMRFADTLATSLVVAPELERALVPHLILQPLVENALHHGLGDVETDARLEVVASRSGDALRLEVRDNGAGLPPGWQIDRARGVGLGNTQSRLRQRYGDHGRVDVRTRPEGGTIAVIELPFRTVAP
jgi:signal transduction histidine kinase